MTPPRDRVRYQLVFRTSRGGRGIPPAHAAAEFAAVFGARASLTAFETPARAWVTTTLGEEELRQGVSLLGYARALIRLEPAPGAAEGTAPVAGSLRGVRREQGELTRFTPLFVEESAQHGAASSSSGLPDRRRRLSIFDARFITNLACLAPKTRVLDPFAGPGVLGRTLSRRGFEVTLLERDPHVAASAGAIVGNAAALPFGGQVFGAVITEPPYDLDARDDVLAALTEFERVLVPGGRIVLLVDDAMVPALCARAERGGWLERGSWPLARHSRSTRLLVYDLPLGP